LGLGDFFYPAAKKILGSGNIFHQAAKKILGNLLLTVVVLFQKTRAINAKKIGLAFICLFARTDLIARFQN
jgi:hypothetical protein